MADNKGHPKSSALPPGLHVLLSEARSGCTSVEQGSFKLDWRRALDKIKRFKLADPHLYVLELVQAAVAAGASSVAVRMDSDDMFMEFDGTPYARAELENVFEHLFSQDRSTARLTGLALGVNTGLGMNPRFITVESGDGVSGVRLRLSSLHNLRVESIGGPAAPNGTRIHLRERMSWKVVGEAVWKRNPEELILQRHCRYAPIPVTLAGSDLRSPLLHEPLARMPFRGRNGRGEVALPYAPEPKSHLVFCLNGVVISDQPGRPTRRAMGGLGFHGFMDSPFLTRNASHTDIVRNKVYNRCGDTLHTAARRLLRYWLRAELLGKQEGVSDRATVRTFGRRGERTLARLRYLRAAATAFLRPASSEPLADELEALLDVPGLVELPLQDTPNGTLRPLWDAYRREKTCRVTERRYDVCSDDLPADVAVVLVTPETVDMLQVVFKRAFKSADKLLKHTEQRTANRRRLEGLRQTAHLPQTTTLVRAPVEWTDPPMTGEVGLPDGPVEGQNVGYGIRFLRSGIPLSLNTVPDNVDLPGMAVLDSPDFEPNQTWDGVAPNAVYDVAVSRVAAAAGLLLEGLRNQFPNPPPPPSLVSTDYWSPDGAVLLVKSPLAGKWRADGISSYARQHIDRLLAREGIPDPTTTEWFETWPLLHTLEGDAVSPRDSVAAHPTPFVLEMSWGGRDEPGTLNLTPALAAFVQRFYPGQLKNHTAQVEGERTHRTAQWRNRRLWNENRARVSVRKQAPRLDPSRYAAVVDLPREIGTGQVGLTADGMNAWVRFLHDGIPVEQQLLQAPLPLHAVLEGPGIVPNETFTGVKRTPAVAAAHLAVCNLAPRLLAHACRNQTVPERCRYRLMWQYCRWLADRVPDHKAAAIPPEILEVPFVGTIAHGILSLKALCTHATADVDDKSAHRAAHIPRLYFVTIEGTRQLCTMPLLRCSRDEGDVLSRLLSVDTVDYSEQYARQLSLLDRMSGRREPPCLGCETALRLDIGEGDIRGQIGIPMRLGDAAWRSGSMCLRILCQGVLFETAELALYHVPLLGVIDSPDLTLDQTWAAVDRNDAWQRCTEALRKAVRALVLDICAHIAGSGTSAATVDYLRLALHVAAGRLFANTPRLENTGSDELLDRIAATPAWPLLDGGYISLRDISVRWRQDGRVLGMVAAEAIASHGHFVIAALSKRTLTALEAIFGDTLDDATPLLARYATGRERRRTAEPLGSLDPGKYLVVRDVSFHDEHTGLSVSGQAGIPVQYLHADTDLQMRVGVDGLLLRTETMPHPLRGDLVLECRGLRANADWTAPSDPEQIHLLHAVADRALWQCLAGDVRIGSYTGPRDERRRALYLEALTALHDRASDDMAAVRDTLMRLPLFESMAGETLSAERVFLEAQRDGCVRAVSAKLPKDGLLGERLVVWADDSALECLHALLGEALERFDTAWERRAAWRKTRLPTVLSVTIDEPRLQAEIGIPHPLPPFARPYAAHLRMLYDGRPVHEREVVLHCLPAVGFVNSEAFTLEPSKKRIANNHAWREAKKRLLGAVEQLIRNACDAVTRETLPPPSLATVCRALQICAGRFFKNRPALQRSPGNPIHGPLVNAPIWSMPNGTRVSLSSIVAHWRRTGRVHTVGDVQGPVAPGRLFVCSPEKSTRDALRDVFGDDLRDGSSVFRRESTALERARNAGPLPQWQEWRVLRTVAVTYESPDGALSARGCLGPPVDYVRQPRGIALVLGVDGRRLCDVTLEHPLRALACIDCTGLAVNPAWTNPADDGQFDALAGALRDCMRSCVEAIAADAAMDSPGTVSYDTRCMLLEAMEEALRSTEGQQPDLEHPMYTVPLFATVDERWIDARSLLRSADGRTVPVVGNGTPKGSPEDGRLIVWADDTELDVLRLLLGPKMQQCDTAWRAELEWRKRTDDKRVALQVRTVVLKSLRRRTRRCLAGTIGMLEPIRKGGTRVVVQKGDRYYLNTGSPVWRATIAALRAMPLGAAHPSPVLHLAAAVVAELGGTMLNKRDFLSSIEALSAMAMRQAGLVEGDETADNDRGPEPGEH